MIKYGDGREPPPAVPRETIELQRAAHQIALTARHRLSEDFELHVEADISPVLLRLCFHYAKRSFYGARDETKTVELDLHPGLPIDDRIWLRSLTEDVLKLVLNSESDLIIPQPLEYIRICDSSGKTLYEQGRTFNDKVR
jgi:hypothetical protein